MKNVVILIKAGNGLDRTDLEKLFGCSFDTEQELLDAIDVDGRKLFLDGKIQVWKEEDFMDAWNNTDDDATELEIQETFLGFAKIKHL